MSSRLGRASPVAIGGPRARGWRTLVSRAGRVVAFIAPAKDHMNLGFYRGRELPDPHGLLEGSGKDLRHVKARSLEGADEAALARLVRAAFDLHSG